MLCHDLHRRKIGMAKNVYDLTIIVVEKQYETNLDPLLVYLWTPIITAEQPGVDVISKFQQSTTTLCWNKAIWLVICSHMTWNLNQSDWLHMVIQIEHKAIWLVIWFETFNPSDLFQHRVVKHWNLFKTSNAWANPLKICER